MSRPRRFRWVGWMIVASVSLFISRAVTASATDAPSSGDTVVSSSIADARNLIPPLASDGASQEICGLVFNGLVKYAPNMTLVGDLAERWDVQDDGLTIVFHLRPNVRWQDGKPLTARDVEFTYQTLIDPKVPTPYSGDFEQIQSLDVLDEQPEGMIFVVPARLEPCEVPETLSRLHFADLFSPKGYEKLKRALELRATQLGFDGIAR